MKVIPNISYKQIYNSLYNISLYDRLDILDKFGYSNTTIMWWDVFLKTLDKSKWYEIILEIKSYENKTNN